MTRRVTVGGIFKRTRRHLVSCQLIDLRHSSRKIRFCLLPSGTLNMDFSFELLLRPHQSRQVALYDVVKCHGYVAVVTLVQPVEPFVLT